MGADRGHQHSLQRHDAPLGKFGLRGVAWYQERPTLRSMTPQRYQAQLAALFADWRRQFDAPLPWLVVQLANWGALAKSPVDSGWARLRDAQRAPSAPMATRGSRSRWTSAIATTSIRLTSRKWAGAWRALRATSIYGEKSSASGAQPRSATRDPAGVALSLGDFDGSLLVIGAQDPAASSCAARRRTPVTSCVRNCARAAGTVADPGAATRVRSAGRQPAVQSLRQHGITRGAIRDPIN